MGAEAVMQWGQCAKVLILFGNFEEPASPLPAVILITSGKPARLQPKRHGQFGVHAAAGIYADAKKPSFLAKTASQASTFYKNERQPHSSRAFSKKLYLESNQPI